MDSSNQPCSGNNSLNPSPLGNNSLQGAAGASAAFSGNTTTNTGLPQSIFPGNVDPALLMNPHTAAAVAAVAAAAAQHMATPQQQDIAGTAFHKHLQNASGSHLHHHHHQQHVPRATSHHATTATTTTTTAHSAPSSTAPTPGPVMPSSHTTPSASAAVPQASTASAAHMMAALFTAGLNSAANAASTGQPNPVQLPLPVPAQNMPFQMPSAGSAHHHQQAQSLVAQPQTHYPSNPAAVAAAAAQVVAAHSAASNPKGAMTSTLFANIKQWKLPQLEAHVQLLRETNQPIPQPVAMLLAEARRKEEKRTAKRVANRKSACTSRARKKALVEEMTRTNARLRRQALILALLPDLVIAIKTNGDITFCSAQVERMLRHKNEDLVGANINQILVPASRQALQRLIEKLVSAEQSKASTDITVNAEGGDEGSKEIQEGENDNSEGKVAEEGDNGNGNASAESGSGSAGSGGAAIVSEQSFPLSVVNVDRQGQQSSGGEENSDLSTSNAGGKPVAPVSSLINNSLSRSTTNSSFGNQVNDSEDTAQAVAAGIKESANVALPKSDSSTPPPSPKKDRQPQASSDDSISSSSDVKNLRKANEVLNRNVRWHNEKLLGKSKAGSSKNSHKDDVTGASVTANNADARLSSLQHRPCEEPPPKKKKKSSYETLEDQCSSSSADSLLAGVEEKKKNRSSKDGTENCSDDSGYRESNESQSSREDASSDTSSNSRIDNKDRPKPMAPTCNVCLIRDDLTTMWCEVTSSIRTRSLKDETNDTVDPAPQGAIRPSSNGASSGSGNKSPKSPSPPASEVPIPQEEMRELLLCLRPIRDGEEVVNESQRFVPVTSDTGETTPNASATGTSNSTTNSGDSGVSTGNSGDSAGNDASEKKRPPKKRPIPQEQSETKGSDNGRNPKRGKKSPLSTDTEKSVVESLMLMSNK